MKKLKELLQKRCIRLILLAVSGIVTGLTVCFPALGVVEWFSLIPAALIMLSLANDKKNRLRSVYAYGLFFFMCYFVATWHWFYVMYPMSYTGMSEFAVITVLAAAMLGLPLLQSTAFAFIFVLSALIMRGALVKRFLLVFPFGFAALWTIFEWFQTLFWFGVPWGRLAIGQTGVTITMQTASWFGCYFITFLLVAVNSLIACALYSTSARKLFSIVAAAIFAFNTAAGAIIMLIPPKTDETVRVAVIQGNISSADKWDVGEWFDITCEPYERLTHEAAEDGAKIVVWPETVFPVSIEYSGKCRDFITDLARECEVTLLVGTASSDDEDENQYNSVITVFPDGTISVEKYNKQKLVPFGEYVPWRNLITAVIPALGDINMLDGDLTPGNASTVTDTGFGVVGSAICFDSIYEELIRKSVKNGAEIIAIETNDSWFYDSAAVSMHLAQAKLRAVENRRYVLRAANTGISAIISPDGRALYHQEALTEGLCVADVGLCSRNTLYTCVGNIIVWLSMVSVLAVITYDITVKLRQKKEL